MAIKKRVAVSMVGSRRFSSARYWMSEFVRARRDNSAPANGASRWPSSLRDPHAVYRDFNRVPLMVGRLLSFVLTGFQKNPVGGSIVKAQLTRLFFSRASTLGPQSPDDCSPLPSDG